MSLKLKRNYPLVLSLLTVLLVLTVFFGNLRVGAYNVRFNLGTAGDSGPVSTASLVEGTTNTTTVSTGELMNVNSAVQEIKPVSSYDLPSPAADTN